MDILLSNKHFQNLKLRSKIILEIRKILHRHNFFEIQTPILNKYFNGLNSQPFSTHCNTLDNKLFLRTAPELYLKRLLVSGFDRVFEISKCFRNENLSNFHHYEFTSLEFYNSFTTSDKTLDFVKTFITKIALNIIKKVKFKFNNNIIDVTQKYKIIKIFSFLKKKYNFDFKKATAIQSKKFILQNCQEILNSNNSFKQKVLSDKLTNLELGYYLFDELSCNLKGISVITDFPISISQLSKNRNKLFADRYEILFNGIEIVNLYSELNDWKVQLEHFKKIPNYQYDKNFIESLKLGLIPCCGVGIGLDRLIMLFTESEKIEEVISFLY